MAPAPSARSKIANSSTAPTNGRADSGEIAGLEDNLPIFPNRILAAGRLKMPWHRAANLAQYF
jgi:hypothetical protein